MSRESFFPRTEENTPEEHARLFEDFSFLNSEKHTQYRQYVKYIRDSISKKENYIDSGGAAIVYQLQESNFCIKLLKNRHDSRQANIYDLGRSIEEESRFLLELSRFLVEGVRTPYYVEYLKDTKNAALIMERLDAINLQHILNGQGTFPESFEFEMFFDTLESYIDEMHTKKGICHNDLEPRNIMIDKKTGLARVIDFGRSLHSEKNQKDWSDFQITREKTRLFLAKN